METRAIYTERKTFVKYDDNHYLLYLNEEVLENHVPEGHGGEPEPEFAELERYRSDCKTRVRALLGMPESVSNTL